VVVAAFLFIHGLENHRPEGHWHRIAVGVLRNQGHLVAYPQLPHPDFPSEVQWLDVLQTELALLHEAGAQDATVVAHSLGCLAALQLLHQRSLALPITRLLLVAPADPLELQGKCHFVVEPDWHAISDALSQKVGKTTLLASDADPWLPAGVEVTYGNPLSLQPLIFYGAGHISMSEGFGLWNGVIEWCNSNESALIQR
jgi:predicted alpha/beta hydrolase family esterase